MISADKFAEAGKKYLGRSYDDMDCQEFFERCAEDAGLSLDLKGCNAWFRKFRETGWTGSPEECKKVFGIIPKGAALFIHAFDGGEEKRGYHDGLGNASHIGIKTGTGKGAIHSSQSRGGVTESEFHDKTIRNGGWNMVGLSSLFDYGEEINRKIAGGGGDDPEPAPQPEPEPVKEVWATVTGPNGERVNTRKGPDVYYALSKAGKLDSGERVKVLKNEGEWSQIACWPNGVCWHCWIKSEYLTAEDPDEAPWDTGDDSSDDGGEAPAEYITFTIRAEEAPLFLSVLDALREEIAEQIGRG